MKFKIDFKQYNDFVLLKTEGHASSDGFEVLLSSLVNSPEWETGKKQLIDHRKLQAKHLTTADLHRIKSVVEMHSKKLGAGNCAFVIADELGYGLIRMYELIGGDSIHQEIAVFYDIDKAVEWLSQ